MKKAKLTTAANGNQVVVINKTALEFTPEFIAALCKMKTKNLDSATVDTYGIMALGRNLYGIWNAKHKRVASVVIKNGEISIVN
jgi:hypothetical protein